MRPAGPGACANMQSDCPVPKHDGPGSEPVAIIMSDTITVESLKAKLTETLSASHVVSTQLIAYFRSLASHPYSFIFGGRSEKEIN